MRIVMDGRDALGVGDAAQMGNVALASTRGACGFYPKTSALPDN
jgi:L-serine deaminase